MADALEGLTPSGMIRTGAAPERVSGFFGPIHRAAVEMARPSTADVDLLAVGMSGSEATAMSVAERLRG